MDKKDRLDAIIKHFAGGNASQFANLLGVSPSTISTWKARNTIDYDLIFAKCENLSASWLLSGSGNMLKETNKGDQKPDMEITQLHKPKYTEKKVDHQDVPLYDFNATAGLKEFLNNDHQNVTDTISIPNLPKCDGAIKIVGDSMQPILKPGDIIMYKEMPLNIQDLFYGQMYLISYEIDGDYYVVVKYIRKSEKGEPFIKLASENPEHASKDIEFGRINALALIKGFINVSTMG